MWSTWITIYCFANFHRTSQPVFFSLFYIRCVYFYYSLASGRICCVFSGVLLWWWSLGTVKGTPQHSTVKLGLSVPIRLLWALCEDDTTEGAFQRKRHIQLADTRRAKEVKLPRLAQPIVLIIVWSRFPLLPGITLHTLYSVCHSRQTSNLGESVFLHSGVYRWRCVCALGFPHLVRTVTGTRPPYGGPQPKGGDMGLR